MRGAVRECRVERRRVLRVADGVEPVVGGQLGLRSDLFCYGTAEATVGPRDEDSSLCDGHFLADAQVYAQLAGKCVKDVKITKRKPAAADETTVIDIDCWFRWTALVSRHRARFPLLQARRHSTLYVKTAAGDSAGACLRGSRAGPHFQLFAM